MALGGDANSMKKEAEDWRRAGDNSLGWIILVIIMIAVAFFLMGPADEKKTDAANTAPAATEPADQAAAGQSAADQAATDQSATEPAVPSNPGRPVDENGNPTPEYLEDLQESEAMEEYYREQMEEAQKQMMRMQEPDGFEGQPY